MIYVGTFAIPQSGRLVRLDVEPLGLQRIGVFTITLGDGSVRRERTTLAPDAYSVGVHVAAVLEMLRDLHFCGEAEGVALVHGSPEFGVEEMQMVLECDHAAHKINGLATSRTVQ